MVAGKTAVTLCPWSRLHRAWNHNRCRYLPSYGPSKQGRRISSGTTWRSADSM